jgi:hypothetical protein
MTETINDFSEVTRPNLIGIDASHEPPEAPDIHPDDINLRGRPLPRSCSTY